MARAKTKQRTLIGTKTAAAILGVTTSNLKAYDPETKRGIRGLPEPVQVTDSGRLWDVKDIERFAQEYALRKRIRR